MNTERMRRFQREIWRYYRAHGRDFPWRPPSPRRAGLRKGKPHIDPYKILVSEVMLQQTQTSRVERKYPEFIKALPNFRSLSRVPLPLLLRLWSGMGYNRRALNLKKTAQIVMEKYGGKLPRDPEVLEGLPGIGPGTAGAICAFAFNLPVAFIETNIRRVFIYHFFLERYGPKRRNLYSNVLKNIGIDSKKKKETVSDAEILPLVEETLPKENPRARPPKPWSPSAVAKLRRTGRRREWYYALMDYGAMLAKHVPNPNRRSRRYAVQSKFKGSNRELRGKILRMAVAGTRLDAPFLQRQLGEPRARIAAVLRELEREGFLRALVVS